MVMLVHHCLLQKLGWQTLQKVNASSVWFFERLTHSTQEYQAWHLRRSKLICLIVSLWYYFLSGDCYGGRLSNLATIHWKFSRLYMHSECTVNSNLGCIRIIINKTCSGIIEKSQHRIFSCQDVLAFLCSAYTIILKHCLRSPPSN